MKSFGEMKISEVYPFMLMIANHHGLNLHRVSDFKMVKKIFINQYYSC